MADFLDIGPPSWEFFGSSDMIRAAEQIVRLRNMAISEGRPDIQLAISKIGLELRAELDALAVKTAETADERIRLMLKRSRRRPDTARPRRLEDSIKSEPYAGLGGVKIALIEELDKAVNPSGYGPYWRAIEYGSEAVGNQMTGRRLYGTYEGPGHSDAPRAEFGRDIIGAKGMAPGSEFVWGDNGNAMAGPGTIHNEIAPRHFLRDGTEQAWTFYIREINRISDRYAARILDLIAV